MAKAKAQAAVERARKAFDKAQAQAQKALDKAQAQHREAFRVDLAKLFKQYQLKIEANGVEGARLEIVELRGEYQLSELPE